MRFVIFILKVVRFVNLLFFTAIKSMICWKIIYAPICRLKYAAGITNRCHGYDWSFNDYKGDSRSWWLNCNRTIYKYQDCKHKHLHRFIKRKIENLFSRWQKWANATIITIPSSYLRHGMPESDSMQIMIAERITKPQVME